MEIHRAIIPSYKMKSLPKRECFEMKFFIKYITYEIQHIAKFLNALQYVKYIVIILFRIL